MMRTVGSFIGHRGPVYALTRHAQGNTFLSGGSDGMVVRWDPLRPDAGKLCARVDEAIFALATAARDRLLLVGTESGSLRVIDLAAGKEVRHFTVQRNGIFAIQPLPQGGMLTTAGDGTLARWALPPDGDPSGIDLLRQIPLCGEKLRGTALSPDGDLLAVACGDGAVRVLDVALLNEQRTIMAHAGGAQCVAWHPHKPAVISGGKDGHLRLWRNDHGSAELTAIPAHKGGIYAITFSPSGRLFATASQDRTVKLWNALDLEPIGRAERSNGGHTHSVNALIWSDTLLVSASDDRRVLAWETAAAQNG